MAYHSFLEAIGNTPTVELRALNPVAGTYIYGKLEFYNPTGSLKDRIVKFMVERAEERMDREAAEFLEQKVRQHRDMDLEDFLATLRQLQKLGPMESLLRMIPGLNSKMLKAAKIDPKRFKRLEAMILSMTTEERAKPRILNAGRRRRVAAGSGTTIQEVNQLVKQFDQMRKMMKKMGLFSDQPPASMMRGNFSPF